MSHPHTPLVNDKRIINAWCMYDWANSAYSLIIMTTFFPIYFHKVAEGISADGKAPFFGIPIASTSLYSWAVSLAVLLAALLSPMLSGLADYSGKKKLFMALFCYIGAAACASLFFFDASHYELGVLAFMVGTLGFAGSLVFYNAFLPAIASPDRIDEVSAKGYSQGYIGSLILQVVCLVPVLMPDLLGITAGMGLRLSFMAVGLWWGLWALIPLRTLPEPAPASRETSVSWLAAGFHELGQTWNKAKELPALFRFLVAFLFYNMGVQTVMVLATLFGAEELHLESHKLIITIIVLQAVAIGGAWIFAQLSNRVGNLTTLQTITIIWLVVCAGAWFVRDEYGFYALAALVGLVMGGVQSMSRATYAKMLPETQDHASFFSFYDVVDKLSTVSGTFVFGLVLAMTGSMRNSVLALAVFFILGLVLLQRVKAKARL